MDNKNGYKNNKKIFTNNRQKIQKKIKKHA